MFADAPVRHVLQLWSEFDQHSHCLDLQAVLPHRLLAVGGLQQRLKFRHVGYLRHNARCIRVVGVAKGAAFDSKLPEHLVPASRSLPPGFGPDCAILNFVKYDCRCHCGFLPFWDGGWLPVSCIAAHTAFCLLEDNYTFFNYNIGSQFYHSIHLKNLANGHAVYGT